MKFTRNDDGEGEEMDATKNELHEGRRNSKDEGRVEGDVLDSNSTNTAATGLRSRTSTERRKKERRIRRYKDTKKEIRDMVSKLAIVGAIYLSLVFSIGKKHMLPHSAGWATFVLWLAAQVCGLLMTRVKMPALLGMLLAGLALKNIPGDPVQGLPPSWSVVIREAGLGIILMRSGLELDYDKVQEAGAVAARLTCLPGMTEALAVALIGMAIWGMPIFLGLSMGFILAAVSPAVVVIGMFDLQRSGYGVLKGIPSLVVAAASFDDVVALSGFSLFSGLAIPHGSLVMSILSGPIQIFGGVLTGVIGGMLCACTRFWDSRLKRTLFVFFMGMSIMFVWAKYHYTTAGAMGCLIMGITAGMLWQRGWPNQRLSVGPSSTFAHETEEDLAYVWSMAAQPLLFSVIGAAVNFRIVKAEVIPLSILVTAFGVMFRLPAAAIAVGGANLTTRERIFVALSWIPKATVQAALGSVPLDLVNEYKPDDKDFKEWAENILTTAVFSIILTAPIGLLVINKLGPRWLSKDVDENGNLIDHVDDEDDQGNAGDVDEEVGKDGKDLDQAPSRRRPQRRPSLTLGLDLLKKGHREMGSFLADGYREEEESSTPDLGSMEDLSSAGLDPIQEDH